METESISGEIFIGIAEANHVHAEKGHPRNKYVSPADLIPATMHTTTACTVEIYGVAHAPGPTYGYQCHLQRERERGRRKDRRREIVHRFLGESANGSN